VTEPARLEIRGLRVELPDGRGLAGTVSGVAGDTLQTVSYGTLRAKHRLAAWVRLLALVAAGEPVRRAIVVGRRGDGGAVAMFAVPDDGNVRSWALEQLAGLAELRDRGLREPLPLACETAAAYVNALPRGEAAAMSAAADAWTSGFNYPKEDQDPEHVFAFGDRLTFEELWTGARAGSDAHFAELATRLWEGPRQWART
jgi:exodeoxyribonuclease V gamma subunit